MSQQCQRLLHTSVVDPCVARIDDECGEGGRLWQDDWVLLIVCKQRMFHPATNPKDALSVCERGKFFYLTAR